MTIIARHPDRFYDRFAGAVRDAHWLTFERARAYRLILLLVLVVSAAFWLLSSPQGIDPAGKPIGTDFLAFWSASRLALAGDPAAAYDLARLYAMERASVAQDPGLSSFLYPPPFLLLCLPFGLAPYFLSLAIWLAATGGAWLAMARKWAGKGAGALIALLAFPAIMTNIGHGQNGFLTAALMGSGLLLIDRRPWLSGAVLGLLVVKPQIALALPLLVLAGNRWRVMSGAIASLLAVSLLSLLVLGPGTWTGFIGGSGTGRAIMEAGLVEPGKMVSIFAAVQVLHGGVALGYALQCVAALAASALLIVACRKGAPAAAQGALCVTATLLMTPFLFDYDLPVLIAPLAWLYGEAMRRGFLPWEKAILAAAYLLPLYARTLALGLGIPTAPVVLILLMTAIVRAALMCGDAADKSRGKGSLIPTRPSP
jgi:alpha-1,2-mannosyltransferase